MSDVFFVSSFCNTWFNKHFNWYQQAEPTIQKDGYLTFPHTVRFFVEWSGLNKIEYGWLTNPFCVHYTTIYNNITMVMKK